MKNVILKTVIAITLASINVWAGIGGIGGGTSSRMERSELLNILKSRDIDLTMPQITFSGEFAGTYFVTVDQVCATTDKLETIKAVNQHTFNDSDFTSSRKPIVKSLVRNREYSVETQKGIEKQIIPLEQTIQIYRLNSLNDDRGTNKTFLGAKTYLIPDCQSVRAP